MPDAPAGTASFPGIERVISASYTLSHGITPGVALLTIVPQANFPELIGDLTFTFGNVRLSFADMKMDKTSFRYDQSGLIYQISLLDRRWEWRHSNTSGLYNKREPDKAGEILLWTEKSPREMASGLLFDLQEINFDVSGLPDLPRPEIEWQLDNGAKALEDLADMFGCRVVLRLDNTVGVLPAGVGGALPTGGLMAGGATVDPPERPDRLLVACSPTLFQIDVLLEAIGEDRTGEIVPIDELSYKPARGWENVHPLGPAAFLAVGDPTKQNDRDRELAKKSVYRMYRITTKDAFGDGQKNIVVPKLIFKDGGDPNEGGEEEDDFEVVSYKQLLPLDDKQCETEGWVDQDGILRTSRKPALVWGTFYFGGPPGISRINTELPEQGKPVPFPGPERGPNPNHYGKPFTIDGERGIVTFSEPVFWWDTQAKKYEPAKLALRAAATVRRGSNLVYARYYVRHVFPPPRLGRRRALVRILRHEELTRRISPEYSPGRGEPIPDSWVDNREDIDQEGQYYLDAAKREYEQTYPEERIYMGLLPINPDGAIQQVTWNVGPQGATTQASRNTEHSLYVPSYKERRFLELLHGGRFWDIEDAAKRLRRLEWFKRQDNA